MHHGRERRVTAMNPATSSAQSLERGRRAFATQAWSDAYEHLEAADGGQSLAVEDLERLATTAHMLGRADDATRAWERAHQAAVREGDIARAVRHAFHLVMGSGSVVNSPRPAVGSPVPRGSWRTSDRIASSAATS
jgi:hypothetical protein